MSARNNPIQFDPTQYYILSEAFFRVGLAIFPNEWTGREQFAAPVAGIENIKARKAELEVTFERHIKSAQALASLGPASLSPSDFEAQLVEQKTMRKRAFEARDELQQIGRTYDAQYSDDEEWQRRRTVEKILCDAFSQEELTLVCGASWKVSWDRWYREKDFVISFPYSLVYAPRQQSGRRKNTAYIPKDQFNTWHAVQSCFISGDAHKTERQKVEAFFLAAAGAKVTPPRNKNEFISNLRKKFPELSERSALRYWDDLAPEEWKRPGVKPT